MDNQYLLILAVRGISRRLTVPDPAILFVATLGTVVLMLIWP